MRNITELIRRFNKKKYQRSINKKKYTFKMEGFPVSILNYTMLAYGIELKNLNTKKIYLYYIPFSFVCELKKLNDFDKHILKYIKMIIIIEGEKNEKKC